MPTTSFKGHLQLLPAGLKPCQSTQTSVLTIAPILKQFSAKDTLKECSVGQQTFNYELHIMFEPSKGVYKHLRGHSGANCDLWQLVVYHSVFTRTPAIYVEATRLVTR